VHRVLVLYLPPKDPQASREYFENTHIPLAAKMPGQRSMRYSFEVAAADGESPYFGVMEAEFDDVEALGAAMASPEGQAVVADIPNYATGGRRRLELPRSGSAIAIASISPLPDEMVQPIFVSDTRSDRDADICAPSACAIPLDVRLARLRPMSTATEN
jgi:uncharacterized protein (TIGR02118 family)